VIDQIFLLVTGATAVWLSQDTREHVRKYAPIFGLLSQPFWFYASFTAGQWGIFAISFVYAYAWCRGFYNQWIKK